MSVKVAIPRDIESSFNGSIAMPDTATGEQEWQEESDITFQTSSISIPSGVVIDVIYIDESSGAGPASGAWILHGNVPSGFKLTQFDNAASQIRSVTIPTPTQVGGRNEAFSLSLVSDSLIYIGMAFWNPDGSQQGWGLYYGVYDIINLQLRSATVSLPSARYNEYGQDSNFRIKTNGSQSVVIASNAEGPLITSSEVAVFNSEGVVTGLTSQSFSDVCITNTDVFALALSPIPSDGEIKTRVSVFDYNLSLKESFDFPRITGNWSRPTINYAINKISHSTEWSSGQVLTRAYNRRMVNIGSYKGNDEVIKSSTKRKYRCAVDATFDDPEIGVNLSPPTWTDIGSTNRFAVLDSNTSQRSIFNSSGFVSCSITNPVDTVGIFGLSGVQSATVSVISGGSNLYAETKSGMDSEFSDVEIRDIIFSVPPFSNVTIRVDFTGSNVRVGRFAVGVSEVMGRAVSGTELGDIDYSILEFDEFGNTRYVPRPIVSFHTFQVDVDKQKSLSVARKLQSIGGKDAMWNADVGLSEPLVAIGKCERFPITYDNPTIVSYTVKVRGTA